jgi:nucleotide-binding universal stress UspA family protein
MKKLLIPTDFSDASRNAFHYAMELGKQMKLESILLTHVFLPDTSSETDFLPPIGELMKSREEMLKSFYDEMVEKHAPLPCILQTEVKVGFPADELAKASEDFDLIIMGKTGQNNLLDRIFGSVSSSVAQRSYCPVLLVPDDATFKPYKNIVYASYYQASDRDMVERLMGFNAAFNAHLHFVHVKEGDDDGFAADQAEIFAELFEKGDPSFSFDMAEVENDSVAEGLSQYAHQANAELVVMATRHRGFWQNIVHRSQTKRMALTTDLPLIVLHLDEE